MLTLSSHFNYTRLIRFTLPSMLMVLVSSIYGVVDGVIVSNLLGTKHFAALNLIWPFVATVGSVGCMMGAGGSALVAKTLGEGKTDQARAIFSLLTYSTAVLSAVLGVAGWCSVRHVAAALGAEGAMLELCCAYGGVLLLMLPFLAMQIYFQSLLVTAERPQIGMWVTIASGLLNLVLDVLFITVFHWGLTGVAWATAIGQMLGSGVPLAYFIRQRRRRRLTLRLGRCRFHLRPLLQTMGNGLSEFVIQISLSCVSMLYMYQLLRAMGEDGVATYGVMMYFAYVFCAIFIGYGVGCAPIISYHYGAQNYTEMRGVLVRSLTLLLALGVAGELVAQVSAQPLCAFFVGYDPELLRYTVRAFHIYTLMFLYTGINIFASAFFTALGNGAVSALISLLRTIVFEGLSILSIPALFGIHAIWWSADVGEAVTLLVAIWLIAHYRGRYRY
ncbi:MAG: polysaccharide biosynthesis C-terminal domain-containing protein [Bacteroidaceae bacterium]|nr:polysaccharide biosynthesis C-terminal domain-containing protein [Bacteroidaceae bacterium]